MALLKGRCTAGLLSLLLTGGLLFAQNTNSGDVRGVVTDTSGAVVPGVTVTVLDVDKGVTHTYVTNAVGLYDTGPIVPDHYTLSFSKDGFETHVRGPVTVQVGEITINAQLNVGAVSQQVVVNTDVPLLQTESGSQSTTLSAQAMKDLPQVSVGADWQNFIVLLPGVSGTPQAGNSSANPGQMASANGGLPFSTMLADGATTSLPQSNNSQTMIFDAVSEVKISDSAFSAQYGIGDITYNQISKGGTDKFHGEGYEYFQNSEINAAPYGFGAQNVPNFLRYHEFGGNIGGPILKKRMFFFFDYDHIIDNGSASIGFATVPTAAMRAGDFTGTPTIYDPTTQTVDANGVVHRQSFAAEYGNGNKIPAAMFDSVAKAIQAYFPAPNTAGTVTNGIPSNNYAFSEPNTNPFNKFFGRLDYDVASNNRLTVSDMQSDNPATSLGQGICPINCNSDDVDQNNAQISDVWTISPTMTNEARMGYTDMLGFWVPYSAGMDFPQKLGWQFSKYNVFPQINITDFMGLGPSFNTIYKQFVFDPSDVVTLIKGRHVLHFGGEFLVERLDSTPWANLNAGTMSFSGAYTASTQGTSSTTGVGYGDFLLGQAGYWSAGVIPEYGGRMKVPQLFAQDDIKVKKTLTVNVGLRWMGQTGWSEVHGNERSFDPSLMNPATKTLGAVWYAVTHLNGRTTLQQPIWNTFSPRLGFSWQIRPNTVLRGGWGVYSYPWSADTMGSESSSLGFALSANGSEGDSTNGAYPVVLLNSDGNTNYQGAAGASINSRYLKAPLDPAAYNGQSVGYQQYHSPIPTLYQWNLAVQRELTSNMMMEIAYVASHGTNLGWVMDLNQIPESALGPNDALCGAGSTTCARPFPQFQGLGGAKAIAISNYNSLQATVQRRFSNGLQFNFGYTWSHFLDEQDSSGQGNVQGNLYWQNGYDPSANYGSSDFDVRNMFKGSATYQLPFGIGRQFLNHNKVADELIGGWQLSGTTIFQSGNPFTATVAGPNNSYSQSGSWYPNVVGDWHLANHGINGWFNNAAFAIPSPGTYGNERRNSLIGPGISEVNLSMGKTFPIWEKVVFEFNAEALNAFNHPSFGQPGAGIGPGQISAIRSTTTNMRQMQLVGRIRF